MNDESTQQKSEILDLTRPGIIEASAGTGKTYTIAEIYLALLCGKTRFPATETPSRTKTPSVREILVVTFTEAATAELSGRLKKRIRQALETRTLDAQKTPDSPSLSPEEETLLRLADAEFDEAAISTIHGFCMRMLRDFSFECGLVPTLSPTENLSREIERFAARFLMRHRLHGNEKIKDFKTSDAAKILSALSKNPDIAVANASRPENAKLFVATQGIKEWSERSRNETLSFDEVLLCLRDALRKNPALAEKIARRYQVALVDEFQDTDPVQWEIFERIFVRKNRPFFCVGDPKQAIYEFRGGDIFTYQKARAAISQSGNALSLKKNWRSTPEMLAAFNEIFQADNAIPDAYPSAQKTLSVKLGNLLDYTPCEPGNAAPLTTQASVFLRSGFEGNAERARSAIFEKVADDIAELVREQKIPPSACAVLVKGNEDAAKILNRLSRRNVPAVMTATASVFVTEEAAELKKILRALLFPQDLNAVRNAATTALLAETFFKTALSQNEDALLSRLRETFFDTAKIWERNGILPAFAALEKQLAFTQTLAKFSDATRRLTNFRHLLEILQNTAHRGKLSPKALYKKFCEMLAAPNKDSEEQQLRLDSDAPAVRIMTIHKSKGLQFDIVFLPSLWDLPFQKTGQFRPESVRRKNADGNAEIIFRDDSEEFAKAEIESAAQTNACVSYVAFTRAKRACVVYYARAVSGKTKTPLNSYIRQLFETAGAFNDADRNSTLPHWKFLSESDTFPKIFETPDKNPYLKKSPSESPENSQRFAFDYLPQNKRLDENAWGIFSFSKIIGNHGDSAPENFENETKESVRIREINAGTEVFRAPEQYDLPAGAEFGTLVHAVFEQLDFCSRANLDTLIAQKRAQFPEWLKSPEKRKKFRRLFESTLKLPIDGAETPLSQIDVKRDALRELEFLFRAKKSSDLYARLHDVFSSWGGIYEKTAKAHWQNGKAGTLKIDGFMHGYIDLVARHENRYYIADWKTNRVMEKDEKTMSRNDLDSEIVKHGYALQWAIYAVALRKFLQKTLKENYTTKQNFGGISYFFVRWNAVAFDNSLDDAKLDQLESVLMESEK